MEKKLKLPVFIICSIVVLYAVILGIVALLTIFLPATVYNDQKSLASIDSANKTNYKQSTHNGITTVKCDKMTGTSTLWKYNADKDMNLQMYYAFQVTEGRAKLILVNPDDSIITLTELTGTTDISDQTVRSTNDFEMEVSAFEPMAVLNLKKGESRIKIACEKGTTFSLSFEISE